MFSGVLTAQNNNASDFIYGVIAQGTQSYIGTTSKTFDQPVTIFIGGTTPLTYTWSFVSGNVCTLNSGQGTTTANFRITLSSPWTGASVIKCDTTTSSGGPITTYSTIFWSSAV